jgi:hypothetical protein
MPLAKLSVAIVTAAGVALAAPAHADPDADFANQLHGYGIYGPRESFIGGCGGQLRGPGFGRQGPNVGSGGT